MVEFGESQAGKDQKEKEWRSVRETRKSAG